MHPILLKAVQTARKHIDSYTDPVQNDTKALRKRLNKLDKEQLIEEIVQLKVPTAPKVKISTLVYAILEDPDCAWLTWDTIAALITTSVPGSKTTATSLQWYPAEGTKKGLDIIPRKPTREIAQLLTQTLTEGDLL
jgi:hypothetical protein